VKIGIVVNDIADEKGGYTTTHLAMAATSLGHEVWYISVGDFSLQTNDHTYGHARTVPIETYETDSQFLDALREKNNAPEAICVEELDVLLLRNDANDDAINRPWARIAGINFGFLALQAGVLVLNNPYTLARSLTKLYLQYFPVEVRPQTLITRNQVEALDCIESWEGLAVIKPLFGSGGRNVFLIRPSDRPNLHQMMDVICRDGYMIVQEYLPRAVEGDTRLFLMNGIPLEVDGKIAALHRVPNAKMGDMRSNITAGGHSRKAEVTDDMLRLAKIIRPKLVEDGIFLAGLDIVGDKLMEINVLSPGALIVAEKLEGVRFCEAVIRKLEQQVAAK